MSTCNYRYLVLQKIYLGIAEKYQYVVVHGFLYLLDQKRVVRVHLCKVHCYKINLYQPLFYFIKTILFYTILLKKGNYEILAGRLASLTSRSTGPEYFWFYCGKANFLRLSIIRLSTEVSKILFLQTAGAGRTYSKLPFWEIQFSKIIDIIDISDTCLKMTVQSCLMQ